MTTAAPNASLMRAWLDLEYTPPLQAKQRDLDRLYELKISLLAKPTKARQKNNDLPILEALAKKFDRKACYVPGNSHNKVRDRAYLLSIILDGEGRGSAVPPEWRIPSDVHSLPLKRKLTEYCPIDLPAKER